MLTLSQVFYAQQNPEQSLNPPCPERADTPCASVQAHAQSAL